MIYSHSNKDITLSFNSAVKCVRETYSDLVRLNLTAGAQELTVLINERKRNTERFVLSSPWLLPGGIPSVQTGACEVCGPGATILSGQKDISDDLREAVAAAHLRKLVRPFPTNLMSITMQR